MPVVWDFEGSRDFTFISSVNLVLCLIPFLFDSISVCPSLASTGLDVRKAVNLKFFPVFV